MVRACAKSKSRPVPVIVPGLKSGRIHVVDAKDPLALKMHKVIEPEEVAKAADLSAPHTVHCLADGRIMVSMLGDERFAAPYFWAAFTLQGEWR